MSFIENDLIHIYKEINPDNIFKKEKLILLTFTFVMEILFLKIFSNIDLFKKKF